MRIAASCYSIWLGFNNSPETLQEQKPAIPKAAQKPKRFSGSNRRMSIL